MPEVAYSLIIVSLSLFSGVAWILFLREKTKSEQNKLEEAEEKSQDIISGAIKKSQDLMSSSELEALKLTSDSKFYKQRLEGKLEAEIEKSVQTYLDEFKSFTEALKLKLDTSQGDYINYLKYLKEDSDRARNESQDAIRGQISDMFIKFEENLTNFLADTQKHSVESIDLELKATRQLIETYKSNQLKLIDDNIIAMLERTLSLVLAKKLSLKDQIDLVYESLEKARNEKFII